MKLFTKFKLKLEGVIKSVNLDWRVVAVELMDDLNEERKRGFMRDQKIYDLEQRLAIYKEKEQLNQKGAQQGEN